MGGGAGANAKVLALETEVTELRDQLSGLERERDFYYNKLRDIELLCQEYEAKEDKAPALEQILEILYATEASAFGIQMKPAHALGFDCSISDRKDESH